MLADKLRKKHITFPCRKFFLATALNSVYFILQGAILAAVASRKFPSKITVHNISFVFSFY